MVKFSKRSAVVVVVVVVVVVEVLVGVTAAGHVDAPVASCLVVEEKDQRVWFIIVSRRRLSSSMVNE